MLTAAIKSPLRKGQKGYVQLLLYGIAAVALVSLITGVVYSYNNAISKAERLSSENSQLLQNNSDLQAENHQVRESQKRTQQLLAKRQGEQQTSEEINRKLTEALRALQQNPEVHKWAVTPIPPAIANELRKPTNPTDKDKDRKTISAGNIAPADARSLVDRLKAVN